MNTHNVPSLQGLDALHAQVRHNALTSFEFFANTVLGSSIPSDECDEVVDVVADGDDAMIVSRRTRTLCAALSAWLTAKGFSVLSAVQIKEHEILTWLVLDRAETPCEQAVALTLHSNGVEVTWL